MARGGARPGAGRPAGKGANTSPPSTRARARARDGGGNQRPWPADKVERWGIERLIPYAKNARVHTDAQVAAIAASIKEWGWTTPALVGEDGGLIAGPREGARRPAARHRRDPGHGGCQHFPSVNACARPRCETAAGIKDRGRRTRSGSAGCRSRSRSWPCW
jgi:hypothetical protein